MRDEVPGGKRPRPSSDPLAVVREVLGCQRVRDYFLLCCFLKVSDIFLEFPPVVSVSSFFLLLKLLGFGCCIHKKIIKAGA